MSILIVTSGKTIKSERRSGATIAELAFIGGLSLNRHCGGRGLCGRCLVAVGPGSYCVRGQKMVVPAGESLDVLACQTEVLSESASVTIPDSSLISACGQICGGFDPNRLAVESTGEGLGLIVDIGTTTVICALVDLASGRMIDTASKYNQQIRIAEDVVSRISFCVDDSGVVEMQRLIVHETINPLIAEICARTGTEPDTIHSLTVSCNTVMGHLFHGFSPVSIGHIPFTPQTRIYPSVMAVDLKINIHPAGAVRTLPAISGYVGSDLTADLFVTGLYREKETVSLLVDIGTNGEIVLNDHGNLYAAATAAGPAFEGAGIACGCRAAAGAIEHVKLEDDGCLRLLTVAGRPPTGLCGSGVIDFIAELYRAGWISSVGRYDLKTLRAQKVYLCKNGIHACRLTDEVYVSEKDIAEILKAKAAVFAGIRTLLSQCGRTVDDLDKIILAGGFAHYIYLPHAIEIGLLPDLPEHKCEIIGNGSLAGAYCAALRPELIGEMELLIDLPRVINLNACKEFNDHFVDGLLLPEPIG